MDPTIFGDDVVDNIDNVSASHINNLRGWATAFMPLICNMESISTTDTTHTLSDTNSAFIAVNSMGTTDFKLYLPVESTDNHPFRILNTSTDLGYYVNVWTSSSDYKTVVVPGYYRLIIPSGSGWFLEF